MQRAVTNRHAHSRKNQPIVFNKGQLQKAAYSVSDVAASIQTEITFFGATISSTLSNTPHTWTAGAGGLFQTATGLKAEWQGFYDQMLAGHASTLSFAQRPEGNAEAVFENTKKIPN